MINIEEIDGKTIVHYYYNIDTLKKEVDMRTSYLGRFRKSEDAAHLLDRLRFSGDESDLFTSFLKSAMADLKGGGKEWAGLVYIGGTHPAAAGAAYMTAIEGFAGISVENGQLVCRPSLPASFQEMQFKITYQGQEYEVLIKEGQGTVTAL